jgi:hypothetical protein
MAYSTVMPIADASSTGSAIAALVSILVAVMALGLTIAASTFARRYSRRAERAVRVLERGAERSPSAERVLDITSGMPRIFYYVDDIDVRSMYAQLNQAGSVPSSWDTERETARDIKGGLESHGFSLGGKRSRAARERAKYEPESDPDRMYIAVEKVLLAGGKLAALDLLSGVDTAPLAEFDSLVDRLERDEGFKVPSAAISEIRSSWNEHQERGGVKQLSELSGYVVIRGNYQVEAAERGDLVLSVSPNTVVNAVIKLRLTNDFIRQAGRNSIVPDGNIRAICVGKVNRWDENVHELAVLPIAMF